MALNVESGNVSANALIYAPGTMSANLLGFAKATDLIAEASALLCKQGSGLILSGHPDHDYALSLKDALASGNNNVGFVQPTPCPHTF
jgi:hypothetical protein